MAPRRASKPTDRIVFDYAAETRKRLEELRRQRSADRYDFGDEVDADEVTRVL